MTRASILSIATLAACVAGCGAHAGTFTVTYVGNFAPAVTERMNASGQIAGDFQYQSVTTAMRYDPGVGRIPLDVPAGSTQSLAYGINDAGYCVGRISPPGGAASFAAIWAPDNSYTELPMPRGNWSYNTASGINNNGVVCGAATLAIVGTDPEQAWRWTEAGGYEMLPQLGGIDSIAWDINASGQVVGFADFAPGNYRAVIWQADGTILNLGIVAGATQTFGRAINDAGVAVGTTNSNNDAIVYRPGEGLQKLPDFGFKAAAYDINNNGWILGWADVAPFETVPVLWDAEGNLYNVADYVDPGQFYFPGDYIVPVAIGDNNMIAVRGYDFTVSGDPRVLLFSFSDGAPTCPSDLDADGETGASDLAILLGAWGANPGNPADLTGDGEVGADDLALLLGAWGPC